MWENDGCMHAMHPADAAVTSSVHCPEEAAVYCRSRQGPASKGFPPYLSIHGCRWKAVAVFDESLPGLVISGGDAASDGSQSRQQKLPHKGFLNDIWWLPTNVSLPLWQEPSLGNSTALGAERKHKYGMQPACSCAFEYELGALITLCKRPYLSLQECGVNSEARAALQQHFAQVILLLCAVLPSPRRAHAGSIVSDPDDPTQLVIHGGK